MKTNCWLILGTMVATSAVAQVNTNKLPEIPPPAIATPALAAPAPPIAAAEPKTNMVKKAVSKAKKKIVKKAKAAKSEVTKAAKKVADKLTPSGPIILVPGPATVSSDHVNLRGQAGLQGEVVGHVQKGDTVNVLSEINLDKPKAGEPAQWAKIALPNNSKVWVDSKFVGSNNVVAVKKLNLRGGPGENYSVLGVIEKGTPITAVATKGDWTQIETPTSAFAFVAASYLKQEGPGAGSIIDTNIPAAPTVAMNEPPITPSPVTPPPVTPAPTAPPVVPPPATIPATPMTVADAQPIAPPAATPPPVENPTPTPAPATPVVAKSQDNALNVATPTPTLAPETADNTDVTDTNLPPPPPRIVTHEGTVRHSVSPVAPTDFELFDPVNDKAINYLHTTSTNLNLNRYDGLHITVTGEEGMDVRWKDTPVIAIQKIYVLSGTPKPQPAPAAAADTKLAPVKKHWWQK